MGIKDFETKQIIAFVKKEPRTVQDISRLIKRSWVTTNTYLQKIKESTGLIDIKVFRKGTQGAIKVVFYSYPDSLNADEVKEALYSQIRRARMKQEFDFMEIFQYIPDKQKKAFCEHYRDESLSTNQHIASFLREAQSQVICFSGNISFINVKENKTKVISIIEELLQRKVRFKILTRVNIASIDNISKLSVLMRKYPGMIEVRHCYQPLRGFIIDGRIARFKNDEFQKTYRKGELGENTRIFYQITDPEWIDWLSKVFWQMFRVSLDYNIRLKETRNIG